MAFLNGFGIETSSLRTGLAERLAARRGILSQPRVILNPIISPTGGSTLRARLAQRLAQRTVPIVAPTPVLTPPTTLAPTSLQTRFAQHLTQIRTRERVLPSGVIRPSPEPLSPFVPIPAITPAPTNVVSPQSYLDSYISAPSSSNYVPQEGEPSALVASQTPSLMAGFPTWGWILLIGIGAFFFMRGSKIEGKKRKSRE